MAITSSIWIRLNFNNFWYNKLLLFNNFSKIIKLNFNIIYYCKFWLVLNNYFLLFYKYLIFQNKIYLISYICNFYNFSIFNNTLKYNFKFLKIKYLLNLIFFKKIKYINFFFSIYLYLKYIYFILLQLWKFINLNKFNKLNFNISNLKLLFLINLKIKKYIFEFNIYKFFNININLYLRNIKNNFFLNNSNFLNLYNKLKRFNYLYYLQDLIFILYITSLYGIKNLFNYLIIWNLHIKEKIHYLFLNILSTILLEFYIDNLFYIKGIKLLIKGKLNGITRKRKYNINLGNFGLQNINDNIIYSSNYKITRFGVLSIKSWFIL